MDIKFRKKQTQLVEKRQNLISTIVEYNVNKAELKSTEFNIRNSGSDDNKEKNKQ